MQHTPRRPALRAALVIPVLLLTALTACGQKRASTGTPGTPPAAATSGAPAPTRALAARQPAATGRSADDGTPTPQSEPAVASPADATPTATPPGPAATPAERLTPQQLFRRERVPTTQECLDAGAPACYTPAQVRAAYNVGGLIDRGIDGSGQGVVIVVSFGSPTLIEDVAAFSKAMGLPDADIQQLYPLGTDFGDAGQRELNGWAGETTLDAEWFHAMAPKARITVLVSPVDEMEGIDGLPEMLALERYALENRLGTVISQSWGTSEDLLDDADGAPVRAAWDAFYQEATAAGVTILTASGDHGALADTRAAGVATTRSADWPSAVPWITTVGGTALKLNADGGYASERVWAGSSGASGSGISRFYAQPAEQAALPQAVQQRLGGMRGEADVSAIAIGLITYSASGPAGTPHPGLAGGTSASTPIWAGIVVLAHQMAGRGLGNINLTLYALGAAGRCFHDVIDGSNAFRNDPGEPAQPGWDLPTGWGTPDAGCLVPALAAAARGG